MGARKTSLPGMDCMEISSIAKGKHIYENGRPGFFDAELKLAKKLSRIVPIVAKISLRNQVCVPKTGKE